MLIVDAHEDLAWNMLTFGRDYTLSAAETRRREAGSETLLHSDDTLLGWPDYQRGQVALVFATLFAAPMRRQEGSWDTQAYFTTPEARSLYRAQLDVYLRLTDSHPDKFRLVRSRVDLEEVLDAWRKVQPGDEASPADSELSSTTPPPPDAWYKVIPGDEASPADSEQPSTTPPPVGLVILMEGAEGIAAPEELAEWWELGLRILGPAWAGTRFCGGTREPGPLTRQGFELLEGMADLGLTLDISHMDETAVLQALDSYPGPVIASHANALALLKGSDSNRHLPDGVIRGLLERDGVIGIVPFNAFLQPGWKQGDRRDGITLQHVAAHIDYICQMAGDARHVGIGSDFDGNLGLQSVPLGIDTVADLQKLAPLLAQKGYTESDITAILGGNWIAHLRQTLPEKA